MHVFTFQDMTLVLDPASGSLFEVDELAGKIISLLPQHTVEEMREKLVGLYGQAELDEALNEVVKLVAEGNLNGDLPPEPVIEEETPQIKALCLHVAHDCNLRCKYCFAGTGDFGGGRKLMDEVTGKAAIDFLLHSSGTRKHLEVDFFGGEPLLNFDLVKSLTAYGEEQSPKFGKIIRFTITTNGTLLGKDEIQFLNDKKMAIVLSIDGRPEVNDRMRPFEGDVGSYDLVRESLLKIVEARGGQNYYVRGTFTAHNLDFSEDIKHMYDLGFREISVEPVVGGARETYALATEHLDTLRAEYDKLASFYLEKHEAGKPFNFFHFNMATYGGPCFGKRVSGCGAGFDYVAVTPEGELYPCHQFVGNPKFAMGDVFTGIHDNTLSHEFRQANLYKKPECMACWAKFFCSGGCHANAFHTNGTLLKPDTLSCELQKKRVECALGIAAFKLRSSQ